MKWNSTLYDKSQSFVSEYGKDLVSFISRNPKQHILDLGCGTGDLTQKLSEISSRVIGIDGSKDMIEAAKAKYPHLTFEVMDACHLKWTNQFDVVFSNAVFHWIANQKQLLNGIHTALQDGGKLVCEFGAHGNIAQIESAYISVVAPCQREYKSLFYFPTVEEYSSLLRQMGFEIESIYDYDRPTPLPDGKDGLRKWIIQFFAGDLSRYNQNEQSVIFNSVEKILEKKIFDGTKWTADYRRIRVIAHK